MPTSRKFSVSGHLGRARGAGTFVLAWTALGAGLALAEVPPDATIVLSPGIVPGAESEKGVIYSPVGKRDPFRPPRLDALQRDVATDNPLAKFNIDQFSLRAILKDTNGSHAMLEDPEGKSHLIGEGDLIGRERGTVSRILNTAVLVTQKTFNYRGVETLFEKVLYLPQKEDTGGAVDGAHATERRPDRNVSSPGSADKAVDVITARPSAPPPGGNPPPAAYRAGSDATAAAAAASTAAAAPASDSPSSVAPAPTMAPASHMDFAQGAPSTPPAATAPPAINAAPLVGGSGPSAPPAVPQVSPPNP